MFEGISDALPLWEINIELEESMGGKCSSNKYKELISSVFLNANFNGFSFDQFFLLKFFHESPISINDKLVREVEIFIESDIYFDELCNWDDYISSFPPNSSSEPSEPVIAFELASIRWSNNFKVRDVDITNDEVRLHFDETKILSFKNSLDYSDAWILSLKGNKDAVQITCDFEGNINIA